MITVITPPATNALTVTATATRELDLHGTPATTGLQELIGQASDVCARYCGRPEGFGRATVRQTERNVNLPCIILDRDIAPSITSVIEDGTTLAVTDYELDGSLLYRLSGDYRIQWRATVIQENYAAGYTLLTDLPQDIERACLIVLQAIHSSRGRDPHIRSESADGVGSVSYLDPRSVSDALPAQAITLLQPWRKMSA
jgi:hypothetical protein